MGEKEKQFRNVLSDDTERENWHERFMYFLDMMYGALKDGYEVACLGDSDSKLNIENLDSFIYKVRNNNYFNISKVEYDNYKFLINLYLFALEGVENSDSLMTEIVFQGTIDPLVFFLEEKYANRFTQFLNSGTTTDAYSQYLTGFARFVALGGNIDEYLSFLDSGREPSEYFIYLGNKNPEKLGMLTPGIMQIND